MLTVRGGLEGAGSDANFAQLHAQARWFKAIGASDRFILRGELGHTFTDALNSMPPSLRYYAGGAQMPFNFHLLGTPWEAEAIGDLVERYEAALPEGGGTVLVKKAPEGDDRDVIRALARRRLAAAARSDSHDRPAQPFLAEIAAGRRG